MWTAWTCLKHMDIGHKGPEHVVSYLPLSHIAAQVTIIRSLPHVVDLQALQWRLHVIVTKPGKEKRCNGERIDQGRCIWKRQRQQRNEENNRRTFLFCFAMVKIKIWRREVKNLRENSYDQVTIIVRPRAIVCPKL